jgi:hypothetical protein
MRHASVILILLVAVGLPILAQPTPSEEESPLELVTWSYRFARGKYESENAHVISYALRNRLSKAIKLVDGTIKFKDLLGEEILAIRLLQDIRYPARETTPAEGRWKANSFNLFESRMMSLLHGDIRAELTISKVVFDDNTTWTAEQK